MHAQNQNAKCVDSGQDEGSNSHEGFSASASADFRNHFSARSTADPVIAGVDLSAKRFVVTDCNSDNGFQTMRALDANGAEVIGLASSITSARADCRIFAAHPLFDDRSLAERLWKMSDRMLRIC
jgi:hypothetical protein